jgi:hypothetical protein
MNSINLSALAASMLSMLIFATVASGAVPTPPPSDVTGLLRVAAPPAEIDARLRRYAPAEIRLVKRRLPDELLPMLPHLRRASDAIDRIYWKQMSPDGLETMVRLRASTAPGAAPLARLMEIHYGPWDRHDDDAPFLGRGRRPPGANLYPSDTSARELDDFISRKPLVAAEFWSPFSRIERNGSGFAAVPFRKAYATELGIAAQALRSAADAYRCTSKSPSDCNCSGMATYLRARAADLLNDVYRKSELLWMDTGDCPLDIAIGPYEFYDDRLLGLKASYESITYSRDASASAAFAALTALVPTLADGLPVAPHVRARFDAVRPSPVSIADLLYTSGDARAGNQIRAFTLPNDDEVRRAKGSKNVILRNVVRAKFDALARPVAQRIFDPDLADKAVFSVYLQFLVTWQLSHGLVPQPITRSDGSVTTPRQMLRARYSVIESLQGEVIALFNMFALIDRGALDKVGDESVAATYLASLFDAVRQSEGSPQTVARTIVYNHLAAAGAVRYNPDRRTFSVVTTAFRPAIAALTAETLQIMARGDYEGAGRLILMHGLMPGEMRAKIATLVDVPVDILPSYVDMPASQR